MSQIAFEVARDKIAQFQCADEIADFLRFEEIKGALGLADICPIAQWMRITTGASVCVSTRTMWIDDDDGDYTTPREEYHTNAMREFVVSFDNGNYPDLICPSAVKFFQGD